MEYNMKNEKNTTTNVNTTNTNKAASRDVNVKAFVSLDVVIQGTKGAVSLEDLGIAMDLQAGEELTIDVSAIVKALTDTLKSKGITRLKVFGGGEKSVKAKLPLPTVLVPLGPSPEKIRGEGAGKTTQQQKTDDLLARLSAALD